MAVFSSKELEALNSQPRDPNDQGLISRVREGYTLEQPNQLFVLIDDPDGKFLKFEVLDSKGKPLPSKIETYFRNNQTTSLVLSLDKLPPADAQLAVYVQTPKSLVQIPFQLRDIPLP
jgi:hypothetical protein